MAARVRLLFAVCSLVAAASAQMLPSYQWVKELDASGSDTFAGLATDAQGNIFVAGSTMSLAFPVKAALQSHSASSGLYRIDGPGPAYTALGLASASSIAIDPQNSSILYAASSGSLVLSVDGGFTFRSQSSPSAHVNSVVIDPSNGQILYAGTGDAGILKSTDSGATWIAVNTALPTQSNGHLSVVGNLWIDPVTPGAVFAAVGAVLARTADGGASWQTTFSQYPPLNITFDFSNPGIVYLGTVGPEVFISRDGGITFVPLPAPQGVFQVVADPNQQGRLLGASGAGIYESDDGGLSWALNANTSLTGPGIVPDWANGVLYAEQWFPRIGIVRISSDLQTVTPVGPPVGAGVLVISNDRVYTGNPGSTDVFVAKINPAGVILWSTYFGGSANDVATAIALDSAGNVYVTGTTNSTDFPVTKGAYATQGNAFLFRLNADGSPGYSTRIANISPSAIAVDSAGSAFIAGTAPGSCSEPPFLAGIGMVPTQAALARFDPTGASLLYSTVAGSCGSFESGTALAVARDGTAYAGTTSGVYHIDTTGTKVLSSLPAIVAQAIAFGPDGSVYIAGTPVASQFQPTTRAFQTASNTPLSLPEEVPQLQAAIVKGDPALNTLAATYFSTYYGNQLYALVTDSAGNVYVGGQTAPQGLPARTPFAEGFAPQTGFLAELSGDLSTLLFSTYLGDAEYFGVGGIGIGSGGSVVIGGLTGQAFASNGSYGPHNVWINSLALAPPPALRIDAVENAASLLDGPISSGETIVVRGTGFDNNTQLLIDGTPIASIAITPTTVTAVAPASFPSAAVTIEVQSGGASSNQVLVPVAMASPGIFSEDGTGAGQGYIFNKDGTLNTPSNPASPGDPITVFATGIGPVSSAQGYLATQYPVNVFIQGLYCGGISAAFGPMGGFPGNVFQLKVHVPDPAVLFANRPDVNFQFAPLAPVVMQVNGASSQQWLVVSIRQ